MTDDATESASPAALDMQRFFPYRLAVLAEEVSRSVAAIYQERFQLTRHEWRIVAGLASIGTATATDLGDYSTLDKMQVSRALADLEARSLVTRVAGKADRRTKQVRLTERGEQLFAAIVPLVREREAALLSVLTDEEKAALLRVIDVVGRRARAFAG